MSASDVVDIVSLSGLCGDESSQMIQISKFLQLCRISPMGGMTYEQIREQLGKLLRALVPYSLIESALQTRTMTLEELADEVFPGKRKPKRLQT